MLFQNTLLLSLFASALGAAIDKRKNEEEEEVYDAIVVGGGPSGLATLSALARVRRKALLLDSGIYRNAATRDMHDVLGFDGVTPAYYRWAAREQIGYYNTVTMRNGTVLKIVPEGTEEQSLFAVTANFDPDDGERTVRARKIVLGTGLLDVIPDTPGVAEAWGKGIYWCPWCDGHEHADQPLGLFGPINKVAKLVREVSTLNSDIIAFTNGTDTEEGRAQAEEEFPQWEKYLRIHNVTVYDDKIARLERLRGEEDVNADPSLPSQVDDDLFRVEFEDDTPPVERAAFFVDWPVVQASQVGLDMGIWKWGEKLAVNESTGHMTNIHGVYAVGDANSDNATNVPHALYSGKAAGVYLHVAIAREDAAVALAKADAEGNVKLKRSLEQEEFLAPRDIWDIVNGNPGEPLYAGLWDDS